MATQLQILDALELRLRTGLMGVEFARNDPGLPESDEIGRVTMFDGDPGAPIEELIGSPLKTYRHEIAIDIVAPQETATASAHAIWGQIKALVEADRFLGGLVDHLSVTELAGGVAPVSDTRALIYGTANVIAEYTL